MHVIDITIDNREQSPWAFPDHLVTARWGTLKTGDYALTGDAGFAIERKSLGDFLGSISTGWDRFKRELDRMGQANFPAKVVIIEGDYAACCFIESNGEIIPPRHDHQRLTPRFVNMRIADLSLMGVACVFAGNAAYASALACAILKKRQMDLINGKNNDTPHRDEGNAR